MTRVEFTPAAHPIRGAVVGAATLAVTLIALRALDRLNAGTGIAATIFSASTGFVASSLHINHDEIDTPNDDWYAAFRIPEMQRNVLAEPWSAEECTRIKGLDCCGDGDILREAALSGTIDMVRWNLDKAFGGVRADQKRYEQFLMGPWPQYDNQPLNPDHPIRDLYDRSGQERFKVVADLLDAVRGAIADPGTYAIPQTLPNLDQELVQRIIDKLLSWQQEDEETRSEMVSACAKLYNIEAAEMRQIMGGLNLLASNALFASRIFRVGNGSLTTQLEEAQALSHPLPEWTDRTRALVRLHAHVNANCLADLPLKEVAQAKENELLECLLHVAKERGWKVKKGEQKRLRDLAKA